MHTTGTAGGYDCDSGSYIHVLARHAAITLIKVRLPPAIVLFLIRCALQHPGGKAFRANTVRPYDGDGNVSNLDVILSMLQSAVKGFSLRRSCLRSRLMRWNRNDNTSSGLAMLGHLLLEEKAFRAEDFRFTIGRRLTANCNCTPFLFRPLRGHRPPGGRLFGRTQFAPTMIKNTLRRK